LLVAAVISDTQLADGSPKDLAGSDCILL